MPALDRPHSWLLFGTGLAQYDDPFLGGGGHDCSEEQECGQNVSHVTTDEGSRVEGGRGGGGRTHADRASMFVAKLLLLLRCWTSCEVNSFCINRDGRATGFRLRRRLLLCLLSHDCFRRLLGLLGCPSSVSPSPLRSSMFSPAAVPSQPLRPRGHAASSANPESGCGRRGRCNGGGSLGNVGRMGRKIPLLVSLPRAE